MILICGGAGDDRPTKPPSPVDPDLIAFLDDAPDLPVTKRGSVRRPLDRILVVDDDMDIVDVLAEFLAANDYEVDRCYGGKEAALRILNEPPADLLILDWMMPTVSGKGVYGLLSGHELWRECPVLIITASKWRDPQTEQDESFVFLTQNLLEAKRASKRPPSISPPHIVRKPFDTDKLLETVRRTIDKSRTP